MKLILSALILIATLTGCAGSIETIEVSDKNPQCVRQCAETFSSCVSGGMYHPARNNACKDSYQVCVKTCPNK